METPFRFGLERVRDLRVHDEERAKEQFAASLSQRLRGEALLRAAEERLRGARAGGIGRVGTGSAMPLSGADLVSRQAWVERLEHTKADAEVRLRGLDAELEQRRAGLTDASRRREVLDKLEERQRDAHRRDAARRESALLDEMALGVHRRRAA
jgi:flagellar FliJ protein